MASLKRAFAAFLALVMIFGLSPIGSMKATAYAEGAFGYANIVHTQSDGMTFGGNNVRPTNKYTGNTGTLWGITDHYINNMSATFCLDPTIGSEHGSVYEWRGKGSTSSSYYWNSFSSADKRLITGIAAYYSNNPYAPYTVLNHSAQLIAKLGAQYAIFMCLVTDSDALDSRVDSYSWADLKSYAADAVTWALAQNSPSAASIMLPSFNDQEIELNYNNATELYEGSITDVNGALVTEGYNFNQTVSGIQVSQSGNTITITATPAAASAAGLQNESNGWSASATATKSVYDPIDIEAAYIFERDGEQPMLVYDPSSTSPVTSSQQASIRAHVSLSGSATLQKTSADPSISNNNSCYTLSGAVYSVFHSEADAASGENAITSFTTDASGSSNTVTLNTGTYYLKEVFSPLGFALSTDITSFTVTAGQTTTISVSDVPTMDPVPVWLQKIDAVTGEPRPAGGMSLAGAQYTVKFYGGNFNSAAAAEASGSPLRTWIIQTDEDGFANLGDSRCFVSGDELYHSPSGEISFPLGAVVIYESQAPVGFKLDSTHYLVNITEDGADQSLVNSYNAPEVPEEPYLGSVTVKKTDVSLTTAQGNATLQGAQFGLVNENSQSVTINGEETAPGEVALIIETDASGVASSGQVIPYGSYSLREITPPSGYTLNSSWTSGTFSITEDGQVIDAGSCADTPVYGGISVQKIDGDLGGTTPYGNASFAGITFNIYNASASPVVVNGTTYAVGDLVTQITTDESGYAATASDLLPYGSYQVIEASVPAANGYSVNSTYVSTVQVTAEGLAAADNCPNTANVFGAISVQKYDAVNGTAQPQGDASLSGATFTITNSSANPVSVGGTTYEVGEVVAVITTDTNGVATSEMNLPKGTYVVAELSASPGYQVNDSWTQTVTISENGTTYTLTDNAACKEDLIYGSIAVQKLDADTMTSTPQGGATLAGAVIQIKNVSDKAVVINDVSYPTGAVVTTITTNADGFAETEANLLPYGTYELSEISAPRGYGVNLDWIKQVAIRNSQQYLLTDGEALIDDVARGDVHFIKVDGTTMDRLSNIPFRITSQSTGESHIAVTDVNGIFDTSLLDKTSNTNANDSAVNTDGSVNDDALDSSAGIWFYGSNGTSAPVNVKGAFPYDTYVFEELPCRGNSMYELVTFQIEITEEGQVVDVGTVDDNPLPHVTTVLLDADSQDHIAAPANIITLNDKVNYFALRTNKSYEIVGTLVDQATGDPISVNGVEITATTGTFRPNNENGFKTLQYSFDASAMVGRTVVSVVSLREDGVEVFNDNDLSNVEETVFFPSIGTVAHGANGEKELVTSSDTIVIDTVTYTNLIPNTTYVIKSELVDKNTGAAPVGTDGVPVIISKDVTFQPDSPDGTVDVEFRFDASKLSGSSLVAFERLTRNSVVIARHEDLSSEDQTITFPYIETTLVDENDAHVSMATSTVTLTDTVDYGGLKGGETYTLTGILKDQATGENAKDAAGNDITQTRTFVADASGSGSVELTFTFDASNLGGASVVAFEEVSYNGYLVAGHLDLFDDSQTVSFPGIRTTASSGFGDKEILASGYVEIVDNITYEGLVVGQTYVVTGTLMDKASGDPVTDESGSPVAVSNTFTPDSTTGTVEMTFSVNADDLAGHTVVVFETVSLNGVTIAEHHDLEDQDQTVTFPKIGTTAHDANGEKEILASTEAVVIDTVEYWNLTPGANYILTGILMDKDSGTEAVDANGNVVIVSTPFTPATADGSVDVTFTFDASALKNKTLVAFEVLTNSYGLVVGLHQDIDDFAQAVTVPEISTSLVSDNGAHIAPASSTLTLTDTVTYKNLIPGKTYTLEGTLMNRSTGAVVQVNGSPVTSMQTFTASAADGSVDMVFTFDASDLEGTAVVAFEKVSNDFGVIARHEDIESDEQSVWLPKIRTNAFGPNEDKEVFAVENTAIIDTVAYWSLVPGIEYTMTGTLMDKATGEAALDKNGNPVVKSVTFTPTSKDGSVLVTFEANLTNLTGHTLVIFESLQANGTTVAEHSDIEDEAQTLTLPKIWTRAHSQEGSQEMLADGVITIVDEVMYENVIPGRSYTVYGTLMDKGTNTPLVNSNGDVVTASAEFTPTESSGSVEVIFTFDATGLKNKTLVAFENLYNDVSLVSIHEDIEDEAQTIKLPEISTTLVTEDDTHVVPSLESVTLTDRVTFANLTIGNTYRVTGVLMDKATGFEVLTEDGEQITAETEFTAQTVYGDVELTFTFNSEFLAGKTVVAFEELSNNFGVIATHKDITSEEQSAYIPAIRTTFTGEDGHKDIFANGTQTLVDTVAFEGILPNASLDYRLEATLMDKEANAPVVDANGAPITAQATFNPASSSGTVDVVFSIGGCENLAGHTLVAFETLYYGTKQITEHKDIDDADQTIVFPKIVTTLTSENGEHLSTVFKRDANGALTEITLTDEVAYENLIPFETYVIEGTLMDKSTGQAYRDAKSNHITTTKTFKPEESTGTVAIEFKLSPATNRVEDLNENTLVAFETLYRTTIKDDNKVAEHADIEDEDQSLHFPSIRTSARAANGTHTATVNPGDTVASITDTVTFTNLVPGQQYKLLGTLMNAEDGSPVIDATGEAITATAEFIPETANGLVEVSFTVETSSVLGLKTVVFEELYINGSLIAEHRDIYDEEQAIIFPTSVHALKYDATDHVGLTGAVFKIVDKGLSNSADSVPLLADQEVTSGEDGIFYFNALPGHQYSIVETKAPTGYLLAESKFIVDVDDEGNLYGDTEIPNVHGGTVVITKTDAVTGLPLEGCEISVYKLVDSATNKQEFVFKQKTDQKGRIYFYTVDKGTYVYKETATIDGYYLNTEEYTFTIGNNQTLSGETRITNVPYGTVIIKKLTTEKAPLANAQIAFFAASGTYLGQGKSDDRGRVYFVSPGPGDYYFSEVKAPDGYLLDTEKYSFRIGADYKISGTLALTNNRNDSYSKTGDTQNIGLWIGITTFSLLAVAGTGVVLYRKRKSSKKETT